MNLGHPQRRQVVQFGDRAGKKGYPDFAERLNNAAEMNPNIPPIRKGRLVFIQEQLRKKGHNVTIESIRKWFSGENMVAPNRATDLAEIMRVDDSWLMFGAGENERPQQKRARNALADGGVNLVAALCQLDGATVAFPEEDDRFAISQHIDLHAIIRGASYAIHVVAAEERDGGRFFSVPLNLRNTVPIGIERIGDFQFNVYEITNEAIEYGAAGRTGKIEVGIGDNGVRRITSFKDRF